MSEDGLSFVVDAVLAFLIVVANIIQLRQQRKTNEKLNGAQVIIRDSNDIRKALTKELEGLWLLSGIFDVYQGDESAYYSEGWLQLTWNPDDNFYTALYAYCVKKTHSNESIVTAFSYGTSCGDINGFSDNQLVLSMQIRGRTSKNKTKNTSSSFELVLSPVTRVDTPKIYQLTSDVSYGSDSKGHTRGHLVFTRSN